MRSYTITILTFFLLFFGVGCKYNKILKNGTPDEKLTSAKKYYNKGDYNRALPLLDDLLGSFRKKPEAEDIYYYYAYTHYGLGDFLMASYNFRNFTDNYPRSKYTEECAFMAVKCEYHQTLPYYLDQTNTKKAIDKIQIFINKYPTSKYVADGNLLIDELRGKLHKKAYSNAMLYYKMENYKSAIVAFKNAVADYPDIPQKEEVEFLVVKSAYLYAKQSFQSTQLERYYITVEEGEAFLENTISNQEYKKDVMEMIENANKEITRLEALPKPEAAKK